MKLLFLLPLLLATSAPAKPNVLFLMVDDLRTELACYGATHIHSPNIDALAARGVLFERAYCQQAICNPSRTSLLTGMRPETSGIHGNATHFRDAFPDTVTLPQFFKQHGYHTQACGKIYHGVFHQGVSNSRGDMFGDPPSWSVPAFRPGPRYYYTESGAAQAREAYKRVYKVSDPGPDDWTQKLCFGPMTEAPEVPDRTLYDGQVADKAVQVLGELAAARQPFFLAVGFIKPHTPFVAPRRYWELYDPDKLPSMDREELPEACPALAGHGSHEIRRYTDQPKRGAFTEANKQQLRHGYFACISYIDAQIGRVLEALEANGLAKHTIISLVGDHGYHIGDYGLWGKLTNFEQGTRVPMIIAAPGASPGRHTGPAELSDLYPTLLELAGFDVPEAIDGESLASQVRDPAGPGQPWAKSQFPRGQHMGRSLRTERFRYTEWRTRSGELSARELYDYQSHPDEGPNLAAHPDHAEALAAQSALMQDVWPIAVTEPVAEPDAISFEAFAAGPFETLGLGGGSTWTAPKGQAEIDQQHAHTGKQCLHLLGGKASEVVWTRKTPVSKHTVLAFQAERWTRTEPFLFRIDARDKAGKWREIFIGDKAVVVGRAFLSAVDVLIPFETQAFRFRCVSPPGKGILIDDVRLVPPTPMTLRSVSVRQAQNPVLIGATDNPVLQVDIETEGRLTPLTLDGLDYQVTGSPDVETVLIHLNNEVVARDKSAFNVKTLKPGANRLSLRAVLKDDADWEKRVDAVIRSIVLSGETIQVKGNPDGSQRIGIALRRRGQEEVHTYRIPGIATTKKGTLVAVYDLRHRSGGDLPGDVDVGVQTSSDKGRTWSPVSIIMDMGNDPKWRYDGVGDPTILVDDQRGTIWVAATWSHGNRSWFGSGPGLEPEETGQFMLVKSDDDGATWSEPINITKQIKDPKWHFVLQGPGRGITLRDGTLVLPAQYKDHVKTPFSTIVYSRDGGETWKIGTGVKSNTTEAQVVQLGEGRIMINCRDNRGGSRSVYTTADLGTTWQLHPSSRSALPEPVCNAGLLRHRGKLFFSNPPQTRGRHHMTVKVSDDEGMTWPEKWHTLVDERSTAYSIMTDAGPDHVGLLYEGSRELYYLRLSIAELMGSDTAP